MHPWQHFKTITRHKLLVMRYCFRIGLYKQGLLHDLSKYEPVETEAPIMQRGKLQAFHDPGFTIREETSIILNIG